MNDETRYQLSLAGLALSVVAGWVAIVLAAKWVLTLLTGETP